MKLLKQMLGCLMIFALVAPAVEARGRMGCFPEYARKPLVQMAILLDTSNSMDGLIEQAKSQLWRIANDLAYAYRRGERPTLQVAIYEYGNNNLSVGENYVRQVLPFTTDLDTVSEKLFDLRTNGGSEYCGAVIKDAVDALGWDSSREVYKVVFIAGNEPFTQGPVSFQESIARAVQKGIVVNSIYCGRHAEGMQTQWYAGAIAGRGAYMNIDSDRAIVVDPTPYDDEISRLGNDMNSTYVAYGAEGKVIARRQAYADTVAMAAAPAGASTERALFKASPQYSSGASDVVHNYASGKLDVAKLDKNELPRELQGKNAEELEGYFKEQNEKRGRIQSRMAELKRSREDYLVKKQKEKNTGGALSLDQAMLKVIREQAAKFDFTFGGVQ